MELSFVTAALKRRWWVVLIFAELGVLPLLFGGAPVSNTFESVAQVEIIPPDDARITNNPDRFVLNQVEVLSSPQIYREVAAKLTSADKIDAVASQVGEATAIEQAAETDIVSIRVRQDDPERAQLVAQTIADTYINRLVDQEEALRAPDIAAYDAELVELRTRLTAANEAIQTAMEPYLARIGEVGYSVPPLSTVAPQAASDQQFLSGEIVRITQLRSAAESQSSSINTSIVQPATLPNNAIVESNSLAQMAFLVAMILLGVTAALLWARFSPKVLDELSAEEVTGIPVIASFKKSRPLKQDPLVALTRLPQELIATVDQISVQAEAMAKIDQPLRVAVVGSQRGAGATTVVMAMAARFAAAEYSVVVVDADRRDPWVTEIFGADKHGGIPALMGISSEGVDQIFTRTSEPDVRVLGLGNKGAALRREMMPSLVAAASGAAEVVIFDGGPLMDAASTVELCNVVDAVVLCVPLADQRIDDLSAVSRQLNDVKGRVLPVITNPMRRVAHRVKVSTDAGADSAALAPAGTMMPPGQPTRRGSVPASSISGQSSGQSVLVESPPQPVGTSASGLSERRKRTKKES